MLKEKENQLRQEELETQKRLEEEQIRQEKEKKEIEERLRDKLMQQQNDEEEKKQEPDQSDMYNDAPTYYQPNIIPQNSLTPDNQELYTKFIASITNPVAPMEELRALFMNPVPPQIGQVKCTIIRHKSGLSRLWPKYTLQLSDGSKFLLTGKKRSRQTTSNYLISLDREKESKNSQGYLGKVRSNFLGTEFYIYDNGENPDKAKTPEAIRTQHGVVQYETNVLGSKGPRRMKVLLPNVDLQGSQCVWKSADVSAYL